MEGHTNAEIAAKLGCVPQTVERKLRTIRRLWAKGNCRGQAVFLVSSVKRLKTRPDPAPPAGGNPQSDPAPHTLTHTHGWWQLRDDRLRLLEKQLHGSSST